MKKQSNGKKTAVIPKTAQQSIPFIECYENGIFLTAENTYTLIFEFDNINYIMIRDSERNAKYAGYIEFMNALPPDIHYQELIINEDVDVWTLTKNLVPQGDGSRFSKDYQEVMEQIVSSSVNSVAQKRLIGAISYKPTAKLDSPNVLFKYFAEISNYLSELGSQATQLFVEDVLELLYKQYHLFEKRQPVLPDNLVSAAQMKDFAAPSMFDFQTKKIVVGESYTRILFVKMFDRSLSDEFISDLLDNSYKISVSKHISRIFKGDALENIRKQIVNVQDSVQKRKEKNHKTGQDFVPWRYQERLAELEKLQKTLSDTNCELFNVGIYISVSAANEEELEDLSRFVKHKALKHQVTVDVLTGQQEKGLATVLPFCINHVSGQSNNTCTSLLSPAVGLLTPFSAVNHFAEGGIYYGVNQITGAPILIDRTSENNANAFVLGFSGSGKSMFEKSEIVDIYYKYTIPQGDEIVIIDPENEYRKLIAPSEKSPLPPLDGEIVKIAPDSPTHLNIFDTTLDSEDGISAISSKTEFIMTFIETAMGIPLTAQQKSIISRCVKRVYLDFEKSGGEQAKLPTLNDFYKLLLEQPEPEAKDISTALEIYVTGSFDIFAHQTNINISKKLIIFDISDMGEQLRSVALQVILEYTWQRVLNNRKRGIRSWVNTDEFSIMYNDSGTETYRSGNFFTKVYKRIRKQQGGATGVTQNISEVLDSKLACTMLSNAEFVVLLQQKPADLEKIIELFDLSPGQAKYLQTGKAGEGLIICGNQVIPFKKIIPKDSMLYDVCSTNPDDNKNKSEVKV